MKSNCLRFLFFGICLHARAQEPSAFEKALATSLEVKTEERWVESGGLRYREIQFSGEKYYIQFNQRQNELTELDCLVPEPTLPLIGLSVSIYHRSRAFIAILHEKCLKDARGQRRTTLILDPQIGFTIPDEPNSTVKEKTIYVNPLLSPLQLGFSGVW